MAATENKQHDLMLPYESLRLYVEFVTVVSLLIHHCASITPSLFNPQLKTYLFHISYPPKFHFFLRDCPHGPLPGVPGPFFSELLGF